MLTALDFFAGSGLVRLGLSHAFKTVWANDFSSKKRLVYSANFPEDELSPHDIKEVKGSCLPQAELAWASFPCQDLSLAGNLGGMKHGTRSGLFWEWIRVLKELKTNGKSPAVLAVENVVGFLVADGGIHFHSAYRALRDLGYRVGAVVIDASAFLPQSRQRAFIIAVSEKLSLKGLTQPFPSEPFHPKAVITAAHTLADPDWIWWSLPIPPSRTVNFVDLCELDAPCDPDTKTRELRLKLSPLNQRKLQAVCKTNALFAGTGYKRTRPDENGNSVQRLEIRFDGLSGCLRTPNGGSSRQTVIVVENGKARTRLLTIRECARLMGAPDSFILPGSYNDGYHAMGDAVAVPVTRWLTDYLLAPLASRSIGEEIISREKNLQIASAWNQPSLCEPVVSLV